MFQATRGRNDQPVRSVELFVVLPDFIPGHFSNLLGSATDGTAQRVMTHELLNEALKGNIGGVVLVHGDFLQDDAPLLFQQLGIQLGAGDHIGDDVDSHAGVFIQNPGVVAGVLLGRQGIGFATHLVEGLGDIQGRTATSSLEE